MNIIFFGIWIVLTIVIYRIYCRMYPVRFHTDVLMDNLKEILGSAVGALIIIVFCGMVFVKYIQIIVPLLILIISIIFYKKVGSNKIIITGIVIAIIAFGGLTYLNSKNNSNKIQENKHADESYSESGNESSQENQSTQSKSQNIDENNEIVNNNGSEENIISDNIKGYVEAFVDDVNSGKANLCLNYLEHNSQLYNEQIKNIPEISKNFRERVESVDVNSIKQIDNNKYSVQVIEKIDISENNGEFKEKEYHNSYTVVKIGSNFLIRSMSLNTF